MWDYRMIVKSGDFDTVILLDACRYDYYRRFRNAEPIRAAATQTLPAIRRMFPHKYPETIYVSGNPFINGRHVVFDHYDALDHFARVDDVWEHGWENVDGVHTVPPWNVLDTAIKYQKRGYATVLHFIQPHGPYIGKIKLKTNDFMWSRNVAMRTDSHITNPIDAPQEHTIDIKRLQDAYSHNLRLVLKYAIKGVNGKTCITSDHGELLGENGLFHHGTLQQALDHPKLWEIPLETFT